MQAARLAARRRDPAVFDGLAAEFAAAARTLAEQGVEAYYDVIARFDARRRRRGRQPVAAERARHRAHPPDPRPPHRRRRRGTAWSGPPRSTASICEAIRDGDPELAVAATTVHLRGSLTTILAKLGERDDLQKETTR